MGLVRWFNVWWSLGYVLLTATTSTLMLLVPAIVVFRPISLSLYSRATSWIFALWWTSCLFITERLNAVGEAVERVRKRYPEVRDGWLDKLRARCAELGVEVEAGRLEQEAVMAAQRLDVEEELSRLDGHLKEVRQAMKRKEPVGRRLDFLMQELNREANTLGSKSQDGEMTREAVELKVLIEQMREQVQNIE